MYSQDSKDLLIERIGWCETDNSSGLVLVDSVNQAATSGRYVNSFHQLGSINNIYSAVPTVNMDPVEFNALLTSIRKQSVEKVLSNVIDQHVLNDPLVDYSSIIEQRPRIFDDAIGMTIAISVLEIFVSSSRKNLQERSANLAYQNLKIELEGAKNKEGNTVLIGIIAKRDQEITKAQKIIFRNPIIIEGESLW